MASDMSDYQVRGRPCETISIYSTVANPLPLIPSSQSGSGVDTIHIIAGRLGPLTNLFSLPDIAQIYGTGFSNSVIARCVCV